MPYRPLVELLDDAQQRELDYQLSHETWSDRPAWVRLLYVLGLSLVIAGPMALFFSRITSDWPWYAAAVWVGVLIAFSPVAYSPRRMVTSYFHLSTVSDAEAKRARRFGSLSMRDRSRDEG